MPFYTTKPSGNGIGLSISKKIMQDHDGAIQLLRSNEKETVFLIVFRQKLQNSTRFGYRRDSVVNGKTFQSKVKMPFCRC